MPILSIQDVTKTYGSYQALRSVSLDIPAGLTYGLLGPNGAGKTSLIRIINQITAPDSGQVLFEGKPLQPNHIAQIGYLPEERGLYPKMKVGEQLIYLARLKGLEKEEAKRRVKEWLERFEATGWWKKNIEELSKGMAQKVQFISTVLHEPRLLIFDEPFTGFDPINTNIIKNEIKRLREDGATIIFSTHRMESVEELCDKIALINKGDLLLEGELTAIKERYKTGSFRAVIRNADQLQSLDGVKVDLKQEQNGLLQLELHGSNEGNRLLHQLLNVGEVISFEEELPSLNEIFIQKVQES